MFYVFVCQRFLIRKHHRVFGVEPSLLWPLQDIVLLLSFVHESIVLSFFRPACIAHTITILLHGYRAIYDPPLDLNLVYHTPYNIGNDNIV